MSCEISFNYLYYKSFKSAGDLVAGMVQTIFWLQFLLVCFDIITESAL